MIIDTYFTVHVFTINIPRVFTSISSVSLLISATWVIKVVEEAEKAAPEPAAEAETSAANEMVAQPENPAGIVKTTPVTKPTAEKPGETIS
jgi:hypothetical protein